MNIYLKGEFRIIDKVFELGENSVYKFQYGQEGDYYEYVFDY